MDMAEIPKAELHVHLEGTATPELLCKLAVRNGIELPAEIFREDGRFAWSDFHDFLSVYDQACQVIRTARDYRDVTYDYLGRLAAQGCVYAELMSSPDHARTAGLDFAEHLDGIVQGIEDARAEYGIEAFIIVTCVRHFGVERAMAVVRDTVRHPHPLVVGFGMGGDEAGYPARPFAEIFHIAATQAGLGLTVHAGEFAGPEAIRDTLDALTVGRLGHGVRAIEDERLVDELAERGVVLECCPTSNLATGIYPDLASHPWLRLRDAGCKVTLNSDDPPYFDTSLGDEYGLAAQYFGLDETDLRQVTRTAIEAGFAPEAIRTTILARTGL